MNAWGFEPFFTIVPRQVPWGYMQALSERYFPQTQSLHLLDCEVAITPLDWRYITGIEFTGRRVDLDMHISYSEVSDLLGINDIEVLWKNRKLRSGPLMDDPKHSAFFQSFPEDVRVRDHLLRRLFLIIMGGCFLGNNSSTVHSALVRSIVDVDQISHYDWGTFTLAFFLRSMRRRTEALTTDKFGFYHFLLVNYSSFSILALLPFIFIRA